MLHKYCSVCLAVRAYVQGCTRNTGSPHSVPQSLLPAVFAELFLSKRIDANKAPLIQQQQFYFL